MFKLDMDALRKSAGLPWLMANLANPANDEGAALTEPLAAPEISQIPPELATLAGIAISQQVSHESAALLTARLIAAAMRRCDQFNDGKEAREEMRAECLALPPHLQADLLEHFQGKRPDWTKGTAP